MANINKNDLFEQIMDHGIDTRSRIVYCDDDIEEELRKKVVRGLKLLDRTDGPIRVVLTSCGGSVDDGMAIYGAIKNCRNEVTIEIQGIAASMGSIIAMAGDYIEMSASAKIMIHYGSISLEDHHLNAKMTMADNDRHNEWMVDMFLKKIKQKKPRYTKKKFEENITFDKYIYADEALKLGLIDRII